MALTGRQRHTNTHTRTREAFITKNMFEESLFCGRGFPSGAEAGSLACVFRQGFPKVTDPSNPVL